MMNRILTILRIMNNRYGFWTFLMCFAVISIIYLRVIPAAIVTALIEMMEPYLQTLFQVSIVINCGMILFMLYFTVKVLRKKNMMIKLSNLSLFLACFVVEIISLFCSISYPEVPSIIVEGNSYFKESVQQKIRILESVGQCMTIYLLAFYMGALSTNKFKTSVVLLGKKRA